jgi:hypothetical protein
MLVWIDEVVDLMQALENLPGGGPLKDNPVYQTVAKRSVPRIISITRPEQIGGLDASDFFPRRADEGYAQTARAGAVAGQAFRKSANPYRVPRRGLTQLARGPINPST